MGIAVRGIGQIAVFVEEPPETARFWAEALDAPQRLADGARSSNSGSLSSTSIR